MKSPRQIKTGEPCEYPDCDKLATVIVSPDLGDTFIAVCDEHNRKLDDMGYHEYWVMCYNCDCRFGV